jgi:glycosyltransferase involved in cell wall biosynthesis
VSFVRRPRFWAIAMTKVLGLALYGPLAASNRYRLGQYIPGLARTGIDLHVRHLLGDDYLHARFSRSNLPIMSMLKCVMSRFREMLNQGTYDVLMLQYELMPFMPALIESALIRKPYIYDLDDAFYLKHRSQGRPLSELLLGGKYDSLIGGAATVTAGNRELVRYAKQFNLNTHLFPTVVNDRRYIPMPLSRGSNVFTVGWIGSPSTAQYLSELVAPLSKIGKEGPVRFVVVGGSAPKVPNVSVVQLAWSEDTEIDIINSFDVGVMPLPNNDWTRGKCAFKLIQYMACAVPVVASPVGANLDVVNSQCGLMASTPSEWADAFRALRDRPVIRDEMGSAGRTRVIQQYSLQQNLPKLTKIISQVLEKSK